MRAGFAVLFLASAALAQTDVPLSEYSGFVRREDRSFFSGASSIPYGNGEMTGRATNTREERYEFSFRDGVATGSVSVRNRDVALRRDSITGLCLNGDVSNYSMTNREVTTHTASATAEGECTATVDEYAAELSCGTPALYSLVESTSSVGASHSRCEELPPANWNDSSSNTTEIDGWGVDLVQDLDGTGQAPSVFSGSIVQDLGDGTTRTTTWLLAKQGAYELILDPEPAYATFRPKAGFDEQHRGNALVVKATLRRVDGKPLDLFMKQVTFRLSQRSHEPGVSMNFPSEEDRASPPLPDLSFEEDLNAPLDLEIRGDHGQEAVTAEGSYETVYAYVSSFDWGAYGAVTVDAVLHDGERVAGHLAGNPGELELLIPKRRSSDDPIAQAWRSEGPGRNGDALVDDDAIPSGDGHAGDGLSLYEEYRGFSENGAHLGGDPLRKELVVRNDLNAIAMPGIALFAKETGLLVHAQLDRDELPESRQINFNSSGRFQRTPQHGIHLTVGAPGTHYANAQGGPSTPAGIVELQVPLELFRTTSASYAAATVAHELGHSVNVSHHGESDLGERRFRVVGGTVYESDGKDASLDATGKTPVTLFYEDGSPFPLSAVDVSKVAVVGVRQGQHSGEEGCLMRYDVARFHVREDASQRFLNATPEVFGEHLCRSATGTGVNLSSRMPAPRYGDAAAGRGTCAEQLCVNDAHVHPER